MKKLFFLSILAAGTFAFTACGGSTTTETTDSADTTTNVEGEVEEPMVTEPTDSISADTSVKEVETETTGDSH